MKELIRFAGYVLATIAMIMIVVGIAKSGVSPGTLAYSAIFIVIVLPLFVGVWLVRREKSAASK